MVSDVWVTSDTHFGHGNIIGFDNRPFSDVDEMNETLIDNWNGVVRARDTVYHLGDFAWTSASFQYAIDRLRGKIRLILGNHDFRGKRLLNQFDSVDQIKTIRHQRHKFILSHCPLIDIASSSLTLLHGHVHNLSPDRIAKIKALDYNKQGVWINVGCMLHNYTPINMDTILTMVGG